MPCRRLQSSHSLTHALRLPPADEVQPTVGTDVFGCADGSITAINQLVIIRSQSKRIPIDGGRDDFLQLLDRQLGPRACAENVSVGRPTPGTCTSGVGIQLQYLLRDGGLPATLLPGRWREIVDGVVKE